MAAIASGSTGQGGTSGAQDGASSKAGRSFYERERERLVMEISDGIEIIMSNSNALNRKLEESISVGKEFEPIAGLWGQFSNVMHRAGIPDLAAAATASANAPSATTNASTQDLEGENAEGVAEGEAEGGRRSRGPLEEDMLRRSLGPTGDLLGSGEALPPGVAPGGGIVYGRDS